MAEKKERKTKKPELGEWEQEVEMTVPCRVKISEVLDETPLYKMIQYYGMNEFFQTLLDMAGGHIQTTPKHQKEIVEEIARTLAEHMSTLYMDLGYEQHAKEKNDKLPLDARDLRMKSHLANAMTAMGVASVEYTRYMICRDMAVAVPKTEEKPVEKKEDVRPEEAPTAAVPKVEPVGEGAVSFMPATVYRSGD